ncbi:MAG: SUF system FeS assembly protein, NifU family [Parcubacteria group bacterium GW2011_GWA2_49_9]|nr:MAG: SUF system FeS assembly protein, NifU family [Parcubacteria group bacterium GW2011_GWA2_49_9]
MDNSDIYREEILSQYRNPQNFGVMKRPSRESYKVNPLCGDGIRLQILLTPKGVVKKVRFSGTGCAISIAAASLLTSWMEGKSLAQLKRLKPESVQKLLGVEVGPARHKCLFLSFEALRDILGV